MRIIVLGDTHGRDDWKRIVEKEKDADKRIFIGDYWDSLVVPFYAQHDNYLDLVEHKKTHPEDILLFGNHDYHYHPAITERFSGYQAESRQAISILLNEALNQDLFKMCHKEGDILFSHAGVTSTWLQHMGLTESPHIDEAVNDLFKYKPLSFQFYGYDPYGDDITQSPIWVRPRSLIMDGVPGWRQVVGHTRMTSINIEPVTKRFAFIDALEENSGQYLIINDGVFEVASVEVPVHGKKKKYYGGSLW